MKKAFFAGIVVLLALTIITCEGFSPNDTGGGESAKIVYKDGQPWGVELAINTGGASRAMTDNIAKGWVNYYEVAFMYNDVIYRAKWRLGSVGRIAVPFGNYDTADPANGDSVAALAGKGAAILFAGRFDSKTLLAVGNLTGVTGGSGTTIDAATTGVTFTLTALTTDVKADFDSSFQITGGPSKLTNEYSAAGTSDTWGTPVTKTVGPALPSASSFVVASANGFENGKKISFDGGYTEFTIASVSTSAPWTISIAPSTFGGGGIADDVDVWIFTPGTAAFPTVPYTVNGSVVSIPMFVVQGSSTPNTATYAIVGAGSSSFPHAEGVIIETAYLVSDNVDGSSVGSFKLADTSDITTTVVDSSGEFDFSLAVPVGESGLSWLAFDVAVTAMADQTTDPSGDVWHLKGGFENSDFDLGNAANSFGGAILLGTEGTASQIANIVIDVTGP